MDLINLDIAAIPEFKVSLLFRHACEEFARVTVYHDRKVKKLAVYDYMQLRRIAVTFLNIRLMYKRRNLQRNAC